VPVHIAQLDTVVPVETHYLEPGKMSAYLLLEGDEAAFVDTNTAHAVGHLLEALAGEGYTPEQVRYVIVTHVHLDHSGGTAELLRHCPNATVLAHPKAERHLVDPARLVAGSKMVYGEAAFSKLYGEIAPIAAERVRAVGDGEVLAWGGRRLTFLHTAGHASHHISIHDSRANAVYAGDAFGIGRSAGARPGPPFLVASTSPPDFDAAAARESLDRILATGADYVGVGHFGFFGEPAAAAAQVRRSIDAFEAVVLEAADSDLEDHALQPLCMERVEAILREHLAHCGVSDLEGDLAWLAGDTLMNAMGLAVAAQRLRKARRAG
jgi:glyoxylase-like metal-dependent hydrolase (beta-lactamase superfamily II)